MSDSSFIAPSVPSDRATSSCRGRRPLLTGRYVPSLGRSVGRSVGQSVGLLIYEIIIAADIGVTSRRVSNKYRPIVDIVRLLPPIILTSPEVANKLQKSTYLAQSEIIVGK